MEKVQARAYATPAMVLLAFDWVPKGPSRETFLGFAIRRSPGFRLPRAKRPEASSWLLNRLTFDGVTKAEDVPTNTAPIQKFMWWDARFHVDEDQGVTFLYEIFPVIGNATTPTLLEGSKATVRVKLPSNTQEKVGSWFNRAVISSQAFSRELDRLRGSRTSLTAAQQKKLRVWLGNGVEQVVPRFLENPGTIDGAIYHLTDKLFVIPSMVRRAKSGPLQLVYDATRAGAKTNAEAIKMLRAKTLYPRTKAAIMHNKLLAASKSAAKRVLTGSANFTTEGLTSQANVLHVWESAPLAELFRERIEALKADPALKDLRPEAAWSRPVAVGKGRVRVIFSPEPTTSRQAIGS